MLIGVAVLALHGIICRLLLTKGRMLAVPEVAQSLELLWIPSTPPPPKRRSAEHSAAAPQENPSYRGHAPSESLVITPPIDWQAELAREAAASASAKSDQHFKEFNFPRHAPPAGKAPEFAWDRTHTHRVESVPGALLVHLNDNCLFVMAPLPFVFCSPGKRPANGDLFEHMHDDVTP